MKESPSPLSSGREGRSQEELGVCGQEAAGQEQQVCERKDSYCHSWLGTVGGEAGGNEVRPSPLRLSSKAAVTVLIIDLGLGVVAHIFNLWRLRQDHEFKANLGCLGSS